MGGNGIMRLERIVTYLSLISVSIGLGEQIQKHLAARRKKRKVSFGFLADTKKGKKA